MVQNAVENHRGGFARKWKPPGRHLVQHGPKGKQIAAGIQFLALGLLRRHVRDGPDGHAGAGQVRLDIESLRRIGRTAWAGTQLGQSKIENLGVSTLRNEDVCRLDVAVNDARGMRSIEGIRNVDPE